MWEVSSLAKQLLASRGGICSRETAMLFLLYINDLPLGINIYTKLLLYGDDTSVLISGPSVQEGQSKSLIALHTINNWVAQSV